MHTQQVSDNVLSTLDELASSISIPSLSGGPYVIRCQLKFSELSGPCGAESAGR